MKMLFVVTALVMSVSAFAQNHMVEFNADALMLGSFTHSKSKSKGTSTDENNNGVLFLNVARQVADHFQVGVQGNYARGEYAGNTSETYAFLVGGIYNLDTDFRKSFYASAYVGMEWSHNYFSSSFFENEHDENIIGKIAIGKRFPLSFLNLENVTYSPEVMFTSRTGTKSSSDGVWSQDLAIKFLQFSVFF